MSTDVYSSSSAVAYVIGDDDWCWLKDLNDPTYNMQLAIEGTGEFQFDSDKGQGAFDAIGRKNPVVVTDVTKGEKFGFTCHMFAEDEEKFDALFASARTLFLQMIDGRQWHIEIRKRQKRLVMGTGDFLYVDIEAVEVDPPPVT